MINTMNQPEIIATVKLVQMRNSFLLVIIRKLITVLQEQVIDLLFIIYYFLECPDYEIDVIPCFMIVLTERNKNILSGCVMNVYY